MDFNKIFKEIRLQKSVPQKVLADALDVDVAVISNIEKGKREIKLSELEIISNVFEMSVIDFVGYPKKYVEVDSVGADDPVEAILQIRLKKDKKDQVMKLVFGENDIEILNK